MRDLFDMTEQMRRDETKGDRLKLLRESIKRRNHINYKTYRENNASRMRA